MVRGPSTGAADPYVREPASRPDPSGPGRADSVRAGGGRGTLTLSDTMRNRPRPQRLKTRHRPLFEALENRSLLAANSLAAVWVGQDGQDFAGGAAADVGNAIQDIRISLTGVKADRAVSSLELQGYGGGRWVVNIGGYNPYNGKIVRTPGAASADLYVDPYQSESGRQFYVKLTYDDGTTAESYFQGGVADKNLRMPQWKAVAGWVGQETRDTVGNGAGVGPDGIVDARFTLERLYPLTAISGVKVTRQGATGWASGINPEGLNNAEFLRDAGDPTRGSLLINPDVNLVGVPLNVTIYYDNGRVDETTLYAGATNPALASAQPAPVEVTWNAVTARWVGQDGLNLTGPGDVRLALEGIPAGRSVVSATLSNQYGAAWSYVRPNSGATSADPSARALGFRLTGDPTRADLGFAPVRNEAGATLTLQVLLDDGSRLATRFAGGSSDPGLRVAGPAATSVVAYPGDDLNDLASRFGTVRLVSGVFPMTQPLVLNKPVNLIAAPGATLLFSQSADSTPWTAAIKVNASHTTLDGFSVRFAGPVRWRQGISYGPAVIGTTDNYDPWTGDPKLNLVFTRLDLQSPPASSSWEEATSLFRLVSAASGRVTNNQLKGGVTELRGGPWLVSGNTYLGTPPNTFAYTAFAAHDSREVTVADNRAEPVGPSGKTWRFLVMTQTGIGDAVLNNTVRGIGPMDTDTVAHPNAPELVLTESYRLHYEGMTSRVSADGWVVQIPGLQWGVARTGSVLAILSGPQAGQWRSVAQVLSPTTYLLDSPVAGGSRMAVSLATGFVNQTFLGNTLDARGSSVADPLVLAGNQFGTKVIGNRIYGGDQAFRITAYPSEAPNVWGWTHAPFLGATVSGNTFEDSLVGGNLGVESNAYSKMNSGRVYFSGGFTDNTGIWTDAFMVARAARNLASPPRLVTVGTGLAVDPGEALLTVSGNRVSGPASVTSAPTFFVPSGTINGVPQRNQSTVLASLTNPQGDPGTGSGGSTSAPVTTQPQRVVPAPRPEPPQTTPSVAPTPPIVVALPVAPSTNPGEKPPTPTPARPRPVPQPILRRTLPETMRQWDRFRPKAPSIWVPVRPLAGRLATVIRWWSS